MGSDREYVVEVPDSLADELIADFNLGPIVQEPNRRLLEEQTIDRFNGLKIQIFSKEHPPPHFPRCVPIKFCKLRYIRLLYACRQRGNNEIQEEHFTVVEKE